MSKTIEVSDEVYEFLFELSKELNTQNNRATADPYFFQVQTTEEVAAFEDCGDDILVNCEGDKIRNFEDLLFLIKSYEYPSYEGDTDDIAEMLDYLEENDPKGEWRKVEVTTRKNLENFFFTQKACLAHIERNKHNMNEPISYVSYGDKNPELDKVIKFLKSIYTKPNEF